MANVEQRTLKQAIRRPPFAGPASSKPGFFSLRLIFHLK
jgi:hypothetical protein